jgi:hypothetical protein
MEEKDLSANTFELEMDGGLIPEKPEGSLAKKDRPKRYLLIRIVGSRSGGSERKGMQDLIGCTGYRLEGPDAPLGSQALGRRVLTGARSPWRHFAGADRSRPSRLGFGRDLVLGNARDVCNPLGGWHEPTAAGTALSAVEADRCGGAHRRSALRQQG